MIIMTSLHAHPIESFPNLHIENIKNNTEIKIPTKSNACPLAESLFLPIIQIISHTNF